MNVLRIESLRKKMTEEDKKITDEVLSQTMSRDSIEIIENDLLKTMPSSSLKKVFIAGKDGGVILDWLKTRENAYKQISKEIYMASNEAKFENYGNISEGSKKTKATVSAASVGAGVLKREKERSQN